MCDAASPDLIATLAKVLKRLLPSCGGQPFSSWLCGESKTNMNDAGWGDEEPGREKALGALWPAIAEKNLKAVWLLWGDMRWQHWCYRPNPWAEPGIVVHTCHLSTHKATSQKRVAMITKCDRISALKMWRAAQKELRATRLKYLNPDWVGTRPKVSADKSTDRCPTDDKYPPRDQSHLYPRHLPPYSTHPTAETPHGDALQHFIAKAEDKAGKQGTVLCSPCRHPPPSNRQGGQASTQLGGRTLRPNKCTGCSHLKFQTI